MDLEELLKLAALVGLFTAMSILTVASLTLTNAVTPIAKADLAVSNKRDEFLLLNKEKLKSSIDNYIFKIFPLYVMTGILLFIPVLLIMVADDLGISRYDNGNLHFASRPIRFIGQNYTVICLGAVIGYSIYVVWHVAKFKQLSANIQFR